MIAADDLAHLTTAAEASQEAAGLTYPHPNHGGVLLDASGAPVATAYQRAQGATSVEEQLLRSADDAARGGTVYLNLESGDCHGDTAALGWLLRSGISRAVIGVRHPLDHMRGAAVSVLRRQGVRVDLLEGCSAAHEAGKQAHAAFGAVLAANEVLPCALVQATAHTLQCSHKAGSTVSLPPARDHPFLHLQCCVAWFVCSVLVGYERSYMLARCGTSATRSHASACGAAAAAPRGAAPAAVHSEVRHDAGRQDRDVHGALGLGQRPRVPGARV